MVWPSVDVDVYVPAAIGVDVDLDPVTSAVHLLTLIYTDCFSTAPPNFKKTCSANDELFYDEHFLTTSI